MSFYALAGGLTFFFSRSSLLQLIHNVLVNILREFILFLEVKQEN